MLCAPGAGLVGHDLDVEVQAVGGELEGVGQPESPPVARVVGIQNNAQPSLAPKRERFQQRPESPAVARVQSWQPREEAVARLVAYQNPRLVQRGSDRCR